jgi:DNA-binding transcriptional regulator YdaS (Cro superfamily)
MDKTLDEWLDEEAGRAKAMASDFGVTEAAISQWRRTGVPTRRMRAVRTYTNGAVSLEAMVPATEPTTEVQP